jgi:hypothetical protein
MTLQWLGQEPVPPIEESERSKKIWTYATVGIIALAIGLAYYSDKKRGLY